MANLVDISYFGCFIHVFPLSECVMLLRNKYQYFVCTIKVSIDVKLLQLDTIDIYSEYKRVMPQLSCMVVFMAGLCWQTWAHNNLHLRTIIGVQ